MINMIDNKIPFGLLSEEEKELFRNEILSCDYFMVGGGWSKFGANQNLCQNHVLRLKLKEGEWYTYAKASILITFQVNKPTDSKNFHDFGIFRPATKEEIKSVKPKDEGFVDVKIDWLSSMAEVRHPGNKKIYNISAKPIAWNLSGWVLSGYRFEDGSSFDPIRFGSGGESIKSKATHAIFVKL